MKKLWISFAAVIVISFLILGWVGKRVYQEVPPIPNQVLTIEGKTVIDVDEIERGQNVWQAMGGMEVGSVWGHGSYTAPDWSADWLHREAVYVLNSWSQDEFKTQYELLENENQAKLQARLEKMYRTNTFDASSNSLRIDPVRAKAFEANLIHYSDIFSNGNKDYAIPANAVNDPKKLRELSSFFFWTSWVASTNRPGSNATYTQNWPHEPLVGNRPTGQTVVWTGVSILLLLGGICAMVWYYASQAYIRPNEPIAEVDPLLGAHVTPSQRSTLKYFWVVAVLIFVQILLGVITAHYGVEGDGFYGIPLSKWLPYSLTRTWHLQIGIFWIATAWLAAGIFIGPVVSGVELKGQRALVNVLFCALLLVVFGSLAGECLSIQNKLPDKNWFYFGHQGYEYVDLGRVWQVGLLIGLILWLFMVVRNILPALKNPGDQRSLLALFLISTIAIAGFYGAGLGWSQHTNLTIVEYWRWWVIHLWVEGFFEVFATVVIALFFSRLGLISAKLAAETTLLSATIYLAGGIIGTLHHLYFSGTPAVALAFGSVFSALEVVPLVLVAYAALEDIRMSRANPWIRNYKWPINFFIAVAFWNMLGAGLFGFMINPPIALYYMQGLNTTPVHAHAALFGVYGMLGIGLMLFCLRAMRPEAVWNEKLMKVAFWGLNVGLFMMVCISLLPVGLMQTWASVENGYWYARSSDFLHTPVMNTLRWLRVPGDTVFAIGAIALVIFIFRLRTKKH